MTIESSPPVSPAPIASSDKALMILCHLSVFVGAPFLLPFIVWLVKKNDADIVAAHSAEVLNFHLSFLLYAIVAACTIILVPLAWVIGIALLILSVVGAVRASDGILYRYPLTIRLVK